MTVSKIIKSQRIPDRYYVEFEGGEKLTVTVAQIADYSLYTGRELDEEEMDSLRASASVSGTREKALRIVGERNMSKNDVRAHLIRRGADDAAADDAVSWLERIGVLNDEDYSAMLVRHYAAKGYGEDRIKNELFKHGIEKDLWPNALENMPDMEEKAYSLLSRKLSGWTGDEASLRKATDMLRRRGFSWEEVRSAAEKLRSEIKD